MTVLHLCVGLPGAGKTTLARRLEAQCSALRLSTDDWMHPLFGAGESENKRDVLEHELLWSIARRVLTLGTDVVLDYGLWSRQERDLYRARAAELGVNVILYFLDPSLEELWRRLEVRNAEPGYPFKVTREELELWNTWFERPTPEEQALFHQPD
ncbi:hypothetical protein D3875_14410 [Deinococcus cavernae]|uniref:ATP-binding protein n=1 Tax=Deinococcus cavernae TaxID=2320857 RepID=A0A418V8W9_9DEIO|nr:AAA family ATPase [Deinococcus cavernae]RJF72558.1 hypothetical protein D3875_14410 [Deinococcus cavernae]